MNVKKMRWMVLAGILFLASCGGGGGDGSAEQRAEESGEKFYDIMATCFGDMFGAQVIDLWESNIDLAKQEQLTCTCPGGGTMTMDQTGSMVASNCQSADGDVFDGTMTFDEVNNTISVDMSQFGECQNVQGDLGVEPPNCSGQLTGDCGGQITCTIVDDPDDPEACDLSC